MQRCVSTDQASISQLVDLSQLRFMVINKVGKERERERERERDISSEPYHTEVRQTDETGVEENEKVTSSTKGFL